MLLPAARRAFPLRLCGQAESALVEVAVPSRRVVAERQLLLRAQPIAVSRRALPAHADHRMVLLLVEHREFLTVPTHWAGRRRFARVAKQIAAADEIDTALSHLDL